MYELEMFVKELKKRNGYLLDVIAVSHGKMIYYREYDSYPTDVKTKTFYQ